MGKFFEELKHRNVIKSSLAYLVVAWVLLQVFSLLLPMVNAPEWVLKTLTLAMVIVFPLWIFFSWAYEITPDGIKRTAEVSKEDSISALTNKRLNGLILVALISAIVIVLVNRPVDTTESSSASLIIEKSIAVLPFDDMSSGGDTEWFCDGVTEDILTNLSKIKELKVISRSSVMQYKENRPTIPEIAKELGVSYILEGSVRKHENKVIITAQLIDANDHHLWAENYNDNFEEVFEIQKEVSNKIVQQLKIAISPEEEKQLAAIPTTNMKAYELLLKARSFSDKGTKEDYLRGLELYQKTIDLDPEFAEAYAEMAMCYFFNTYLDANNGDQNLKKARKLIEKALNIDPNSAKAHSLNGFVYLIDNNAEKSKESFERALVLNENDAIAHQNMAIYYAFIRDDRKDLEKSMYHIDRAAELDPLSSRINEIKIEILLENNELFEAEELFKDKFTLFSEFNQKYINNEIIYKKAELISIEKQDWTESIRYYEKEIKKDPQNSVIYENLGTAYDVILNDDENYIKYTKQAYEIDSTLRSNAHSYCGALTEGKKFMEAKKLMETENFKSLLSDSGELSRLLYYNYHKEDYDTAQEVLNDELMANSYSMKVLVLAQQGKTEEVREMLDKKDILTDLDKAYVFAILKNRDSMYYYLDKEKDVRSKTAFNSRREVDPYRKEQRYIEYLKKNYLPLTHWNE